MSDPKTTLCEGSPEATVSHTTDVSLNTNWDTTQANSHFILHAASTPRYSAESIGCGPMSAHEETWTKVNAHVDRGIVDLVSALSEIPDLETLESCQGEQDKQDAFVIFRFGNWNKCGEFLFEHLLSHMDNDIRSDVTLTIIGYDPNHCHGRISLVPAAVSRMASLVRAAGVPRYAQSRCLRPDGEEADIIRAATLAERERCIKIVREHLGHICRGTDCAVQILSKIESGRPN